MQPDNDLRYIKQVMYRLKQRYGRPCDVYKWLSESVNPDTGAIVKAVRKYSLRKAIMMPTKTERSFAYDLSYVAANKNFTYGGTFDKSSRYFLIDSEDIAARFELTPNDFLIFNHKHYLLKSFEVWEPSQVILVNATYVDGTLPFEIHTVESQADITAEGLE